MRAGRIVFLLAVQRSRRSYGWRRPATTPPPASGKDAGSRIADPRFAAPERADFCVAEGSPAFDVGFRPFDPSQAGVYGDPGWRALAWPLRGEPLSSAASLSP